MSSISKSLEEPNFGPIKFTSAGQSNRLQDLVLTGFPLTPTQCALFFPPRIERFHGPLPWAIERIRMLGQLGCGFLAISDTRMSLVRQAKTTNSTVDGVRNSWVNLAGLRVERNRLRHASEAVRFLVDCVDSYIGKFNHIWYEWQDRWTHEFLKLDSSVLEKDDWARLFQYPEFAVREIVAFPRGCLRDVGQHFEQVSDLLQYLRQLLEKVEGIKDHFDRLCQLGISLLVSSYRCCSLFLSQRNWFLHHSAHPPHAGNSDLPGLGGAGALLQLPS